MPKETTGPVPLSSLVFDMKDAGVREEDRMTVLTSLRAKAPEVTCEDDACRIASEEIEFLKSRETVFAPRGKDMLRELFTIYLMTHVVLGGFQRLSKINLFDGYRIPETHGPDHIVIPDPNKTGKYRLYRQVESGRSLEDIREDLERLRNIQRTSTSSYILE